MQNSNKFFQNRECTYFPCHKVEDEDTFNCLFCYCPLYLLGTECGGNFAYNNNGIKSCINCTALHGEDGFDRMIEKFPLVKAKIVATAPSTDE